MYLDLHNLCLPVHLSGIQSVIQSVDRTELHYDEHILGFLAIISWEGLYFILQNLWIITSSPIHTGPVCDLFIMAV